MSEQPTHSGGTDFISRVKTLCGAAYGAALFPGRLTPEDTLAIRAAALSVLADVLVSDYLNLWNKAGAPELAEARKAVDAALKIDERIPLAHYADAFIHRAHGEHQAAFDSFDLAIRYDPDFARAYAQKGAEQINLGHPERAEELVKTAMQLSRQDSSLGVFYWILGRAKFFADLLRDAIPNLEQSIQWRPDLWYNRLYLVSAYALINDKANAARVLKDFQDYPLFRNQKFTIETVREYENRNPSRNPFVISVRDIFHKGLVDAGLPKT